MTDALGMDTDAGLLDAATMQDLFALAVRLYTHQMYEPSAKIMQFLLRHEPGKPHYHRALGKALHAQGQYDQAVLSYARAARLGMPDADVHFYMGQCLIFLKRHDLARQALERCILLARPATSGAAALQARAITLHERLQALSQRTSGPQAAPAHRKETP